MNKRPQSNGGERKAPRQWQRDDDVDDAGADGANEPKEDDFGVYATDNDVFLEGKRHEVRPCLLACWYR